MVCHTLYLNKTKEMVLRDDNRILRESGQKAATWHAHQQTTLGGLRESSDRRCGRRCAKAAIGRVGEHESCDRQWGRVHDNSNRRCGWGWGCPKAAISGEAEIGGVGAGARKQRSAVGAGFFGNTKIMPSSASHVEPTFHSTVVLVLYQ